MVARDSDAIISDARALADFPTILEAGKPVAVDLAGAGDNDAGLPEVIAAADCFFCASETDRGAWLEALKVAGRVNEHTLDGDSSLRRLLETVRPEHRIQPLIEYCAAPWYSRDRGTRFSHAATPVKQGNARGVRHYWRRFRFLLRTGGIRAVWSRGSSAIKRKIRAR